MILAITFTRKAAQEMKKRIELRLGLTNSLGVTVCNFHQLCLRVLRAHYMDIGFRQDISVLGADEQREVVDDCIKLWENHANRTGMTPAQFRKVYSHILSNADMSNEVEEDVITDSLGVVGDSRGRHPKGDRDKLITYFVSFIRGAKNKKKTPADFRDVHRFLFSAYSTFLKDNQMVDFGDMIPLTLLLFRRRPDILAQYQDRWRYILCDEFQDVSEEQLELLCLLCGNGKNVTVCGDDDQSIYGWRGASVRSFKMFKQRFAGHQTVILTQTYRSSGKILKAISTVISNNTERHVKKLWTTNKSGEDLRLKVCFDPVTEAEWVVKEILKLKETRGLHYGDICVLSRANKPLWAVDAALKRQSIPTRNTAATKKQSNLHRSKEVLDVLAYCSCIMSNSQDQAFLRIVNTPRRKIGDAVINRLKELAVAKKVSLFQVAAVVAASRARGFTRQQESALSAFVMLIRQMRAACRELSVSDILEHVIHKTGYDIYVRNSSGSEKSLDVLKELLSEARAYDLKREYSSDAAIQEEAETTNPKFCYSSLSSFVQSLRAGTLVEDKQNNFVTLSTIHQAKGLEWEAVFLIHFNEGFMPCPAPPSSEEDEPGPRKTTSAPCVDAGTPIRDGIDKPIDWSFGSRNSSSNIAHPTVDPHEHLQEERRLVYVALSRAKRTLTLSFVQNGMNGEIYGVNISEMVLLLPVILSRDHN